MSTIRCVTCQRDPTGRWEQPPTCVFIDPHQEGRYFCRDHVSPAKEEELKAREKDRGWPPGGLR
jgi:hypothetical protein